MIRKAKLIKYPDTKKKKLLKRRVLKKEREIAVEINQDLHQTRIEKISKFYLINFRFQVDRIINMRNKLNEQINKINDKNKEMYFINDYLDG